MPSVFELRRRVIGRHCQLIAELYRTRRITTAAEMVRVLADEFDVHLQNALTIRSFRRHFPDLVPDFKSDVKEEYETFLRAVLAELERDPEQSYEEIAARLKSDFEAVNRATYEIRKRWPGVLERRHGFARWTADEVAAVRRAVDEAPLFARIADVAAILRREAPGVLERHDPDGTLSSLHLVLKRDLGIDNWRAAREQRYARAFAEVVRRSPPEAELRELVGHMQDEYPGSYCYQRVVLLVPRWLAEPKKFPELAALADAQGKMPWEYARLSYSRELAARVGAVIAADPGRPLQTYVDRLRRDKAFHAEYPGFTRTHIQKLRATYPKLVPYVSSLQVRGREKRLATMAKQRLALARRAAALADEVGDKDGLTLTAIARELGTRRENLSRVVNEFPELFPWYRTPEPRSVVDLELAMRVAVELQSLPLGATREEIFARLLADPLVRAAYPSLKPETIHQLRRRYPELIPDLRIRDQIWRSKLLCDAVRAAPKGQPFVKTLAAMVRARPELFTGNWSCATWIQHRWQENPERFPFLDALRSRGVLRLAGRGKSVEPDEQAERALVDRLARLQSVPDRLPMIDKIVARSDAQTFADYECLCVQHLLGAQAVMFEGLRRMGMSRQRTTIVSVPYSASAAVTETLVDQGWDVRSPPLDMAAFERDVRQAMRERLAAAKKHGRRVLVIDDGGLVAKSLAEDPELRRDAHLFRIVEQTRRGITVADGAALRTSVVNVAQSWGKYVEGPMIGDSLYLKGVERLARLGLRSLRGVRIGVVGFGTIGAPWAEYLRQQGAVVTVLDADPVAEERARTAGFAVAASRTAFFSRQQVILGGTGVTSITADDLEHLPDGCILGSGSSKLVEIDVAALQAASIAPRGAHAGQPREQVVDGESQPPTVEYTLSGGRKVRLMARGYPLNFDGSVEIVPHEKIQLTMALLMIGAIQATDSDVAGVTRLDPELQLEVLRYFAEEAAASEAEIARALREARAALTKAVKRRGAAYRRHA